MARRDYWDDPEAPAANSLVVAVSAVVRDEQDRLLLIKRTDNDLWSIPGGGMEPGETVSEAVMREVREETGYEVQPIRLVGVFSDPRHVVAYDDGEVRQAFSLCFACSVMGGKAQTSDESNAVEWVPTTQLADLTMHRAIRHRVDTALSGGAAHFS